MKEESSTKKRQARQLGAAILILAMIALTWGIWATLHRKDLSAWIRQVSTPIHKKVDDASVLYERGEYARASEGFREALTMTRAAQVEGREMLRASVEQFREPTRFRHPEHIRTSWTQGEVISLQILEADILYRLASTLWRKLLLQYQNEFTRAAAANEHFAPPPETIRPIRTLLEEGMQANPENIHLRVLSAQIALATGQFASAIRELSTAIRLEPDAAEAYNTLGMVYSNPLFQRTEQHREYRARAVEAFENAVAAGERRGRPLADPYLNLGLYYSIPAEAEASPTALPGAVDRERAVRYLRRYLELTREAGAAAPGHDLARERLRALGATTE